MHLRPRHDPFLARRVPILAVQRQEGFPRLYFSNSAVSLPALSLLQFGS
jgi:hypothetical protein